MLLLPALSALGVLAISGFGLGVSKISLEVETFQLARQAAIGQSIQSDHQIEISQEGRLKCVQVTKSGILPVTSKACVLAYGS
jgi:hypothetical protein